MFIFCLFVSFSSLLSILFYYILFILFIYLFISKTLEIDLHTGQNVGGKVFGTTLL